MLVTLNCRFDVSDSRWAAIKFVERQAGVEKRIPFAAVVANLASDCRSLLEGV